MLLFHHTFPKPSLPKTLKTLNPHHFPISIQPFPSKLPFKPSLIPHSISSNPSNPLNPKNPNPANPSSKPPGNFWGAVTLIIGTAVGPGMLGLPSATVRSGPIPSTLAIVLSWVYVISSILLVAELSFSAIGVGEAEEISFTQLAKDAFGPEFGAFVAVVYACLSFALVIACVSGIGSLALQQFPMVDPVVVNSAFPCFVGAVIAFFPFLVVDVTNRALCSLMIFSIIALMAVGLSVGRTNILNSLAFISWEPISILRAIPVTVLTLGFHVITPFMCSIVGGNARDARNAILLGGIVPLLMVLSWNLVVLGLFGSPSVVSSIEPIKLLLSVSPSALPAVRSFALAALATSLIGYAVSFPKQIVDTIELIKATFFHKQHSQNDYSVKVDSDGSQSGAAVMWIVLGMSILVASFFQACFSKALDFAGVYANCFLFGILPPAMAWIHRAKRKQGSLDRKETELLPGGNFSLVLLFSIAVILFIWH